MLPEVCASENILALPISAPPPPPPMWDQTAESQLRRCGLPPNAATLEIATRKRRALCQWRDGVASAASGWVNTHDPRLTFAVPPGARTADPQKYPEKQKQYHWFHWFGWETHLISSSPHETGLRAHQYPADTCSLGQSL